MDPEHSRDDVQTPAADSVEIRLLRAYAQKRRPKDTRLQSDVPQRDPDEDCRTTKRTRKKKKFSLFWKCIKPKTKDEPSLQPAILNDGNKDDLENMVNELTKISDSTHFSPSELETDSDDVVQRLVELLRAHGDELNEKIKADKVLQEKLQSSFKYEFFRKVMDCFCRSISPNVPPQQKDEKVDVALICEATSQLDGAIYHPMNRVLGFGATYLHEKYSTWISRNIHLGDGEADDEESSEEVQ